MCALLKKRKNHAFNGVGKITRIFKGRPFMSVNTYSSSPILAADYSYLNDDMGFVEDGLTLTYAGVTFSRAPSTSVPAGSDSFHNTLIFGSDAVSPPTARDPLPEQIQRINAYASRVVTHASNIEMGSEGERNIRFQQVRQFLEPAGYFSGGLLAAGYDPHEKFTLKFTSYTGVGKPEHLTRTDTRTYFAWEIAAGALAHDKVQRGGPLNFQFMEIEPQDRSKVADLESVGTHLEKHWDNAIAPPMRDASGVLAERSGKADAYVVRGTLQSLKSNKNTFKTLSADGQAAVTRTLSHNGQVIIPNLYGYPLTGYAFIPYTAYDGNYEHRPNKGLMIDLKNGRVSEIQGDEAFANWAKNNRDNLLRSFNARDRQGGLDAHWPKAGDVLDNVIAGNHASYPGYSSVFKDKAVPVWETFNYTSARSSAYQLIYGRLDSGIAAKYQKANADNAVWSDQTEVFGSAQQNWKAAKDLWGSTFGYVPIVGNIGTIVFGIHDSIDGMTASDRVGGNAAVVISGLQLAHELLPGDGVLEAGEPLLTFDSSTREQFGWRYSSPADGFELVREPKYQVTTDEVAVSLENAPETTPAFKLPSSLTGLREVEFRGKVYYAAEHPDAGDSMHYRLYVKDPHDPEKLVSSGIAAKPDAAGVWQKMGVVGGGKISEFFSPKYRRARAELEAVIAQRDNVEAVTKEEMQRVERVLGSLIQGSNAEDFAGVETYIEAGSDFVNGPLRSGDTSPDLEAFLEEFNQLNAYEGKAYRSAFVTRDGAERIKKGVGKVFQDAGVQSASATVGNAGEWERWAKNAVKGRSDKVQPVVFVFDESIPKKNLSTGYLMDHVAVGPGESMKVLAYEEHNGKLFVYLSRPSEVPDHLYTIYDGAPIY